MPDEMHVDDVAQLGAKLEEIAPDMVGTIRHSIREDREGFTKNMLDVTIDGLIEASALGTDMCERLLHHVIAKAEARLAALRATREN